jgi:anti-sigma factor RsiW
MATSDELDDVDPIDEELVAYLDDEIEPVDRARVERRLADDAAYRDRLRQLQRAWDALDALPQSSLGEAFTSSTMTMVVTEQEVATTQAVRKLQARRSRRWMVLAASALIAAAVGFVLVYRSLTESDRELVNDLPVIERVDQLHNTPSVDFLERLHEEGLFLANSDEN